MNIDIYGLVMDGPGVTFQLWSPWRASVLEHRLFESIKALPNVEFEKAADELKLHVRDVKAFRNALQMTERVLKGWQEEASDAGTDRRMWRWLVEADTDAHGYDHAGEPASLWAFVRLTLERAERNGEAERAEEVDLNGFGIRIWRKDEGA